MRLLPANKSTFGKTVGPRVHMLKNLATSVILKEQVVTTRARAIAARPIVEMLIRNARINKSDLRQEIEEWTVDHEKVIPLLYGPLRARYHGMDIDSQYHTRIFNLLHRGYRHADMAVIELVGGPRDTLINLEKYKDQLAAFKEINTNSLFDSDPDDLLQNVKTTRKGRMHKMHKDKSIAKEREENALVSAGREKSRYVMQMFAKNAVGQDLPVQQQPEFWVN